MILHVSKKQAQLFLLKKQLFTEKPKARYEGIKHVLNVLRVIQYDPLNPCGRNPDLVLQSRVNNYHPNDYYKWLYEERKGIECYDKVLCIIPIEDFSLTSHNRKRAANWSQVQEFITSHKEGIEELIQFIDKHGPVSTSDVVNKEKVPGMDWYGFGTRWGKAALETLWRTGRVVISKRVNGNKYYDLPHKVYNERFSDNDREIESEHILRRVGSVGIMRAFSSGDAWLGMGSATHRSALIKDLIHKGKLTLVEVAGVKTKYIILSTDAELFNHKIKPDNRMRFIAPLDTLIWDRKMIEELFGFRYRWDVYVPAVKRQSGYYTLPILYKDQFVGKIEPVFKNKKLLIKGVWKEGTWSPQINKAFNVAIEKFRKYLRAEEVIFSQSDTIT